MSETAKRIATRYRDGVGGLTWEEAIDAELSPLLAVVEAATALAKAIKGTKRHYLSGEIDLFNAVDALPKPAPPKAECKCGGTGIVFRNAYKETVAVAGHELCRCVDERYGALKAAVEQLREGVSAVWHGDSPPSPQDWTPLP